MTAARTVLAHLSDEDWRMGYDLFCASNVLGKLERQGLIRDDMSGGRLLERNWTITVDGLEVLEASA